MVMAIEELSFVVQVFVVDFEAPVNRLVDLPVDLLTYQGDHLPFNFSHLHYVFAVKENDDIN